MMRINLICIGRLKEKFLNDAAAEYIKRLSAFCSLTVRELDECRVPSEPSPSDIKRAIETEGRSILDALAPHGAVITMCIEGKKLTSEGLSEYVSSLPVRGQSTASFIIGGSWGLSDEVKGKSSLKLSMSDMTFPHQLARVMLLEQIYRAFMISSGGKYHK